MACKRGHGPEHLYHYPDGRRVECRACSTERQRKRKGRKELVVVLVRKADAERVIAAYRGWGVEPDEATYLGPTADGGSRAYRVEKARWNTFLMTKGRKR